MNRCIIAWAIAVSASIVLGCSSSDTEQPGAPKTVCTLSNTKLACQCGDEAVQGTPVPSCSKGMFSSPGLCCIDDATSECTCVGYGCHDGACTWGAAMGSLSASGNYCCADSSTFGGKYGECRCTQYEKCSEHVLWVQECTVDTMPGSCPQNMRQVDQCQPQ